MRTHSRWSVRPHSPEGDPRRTPGGPPRNAIASIDLAGRFIFSAGPGVAPVATLFPAAAAGLFPWLAFKFARSFAHRDAIVRFRNLSRAGRAAMHRVAFLATRRPLPLAAVHAEFLGNGATHPAPFPAGRHRGLVVNGAASVIRFKPSNLRKSLVVGLCKRFLPGIAARRRLQHAAERKGASSGKNQRQNQRGRDKRDMSDVHAAPLRPG